MLASRVLLRTRTTASRHLSTRVATVLNALDLPTNAEIPGVYDGTWGGSGDLLESKCPTTGEVLGRVKTVRRGIRLGNNNRLTTVHLLQASPKELHEALDKTREAYRYIRSVPAPRRGEILRQVREALSAKVLPPVRSVPVPTSTNSTIC
jgi:aldehyde dehydrogenase family 7 protein A1